jgi:gliding motility-associated-like protein
MYLPSLNYTRRVIRHLLFFFVLAGLAHQSAFSQTSTDFWFAPPEVSQGHAGSTPILIRVASGADPAIVTIDLPANPGALNGGAPITVSLTANESQTINLNAFVNILETRPPNSVLNTGIHITSTANITAIYEVSPTNNPDIWALKGQNGLGTEFVIPMQNYWPNGNYNPDPYTSFDIVATEDNTTVLIYPTSDLDDGSPAFQSFTITLNEGQTYSCSVTDLMAVNNPTGSVVLSDKPVAVSIKDDSISPLGQGCRDLVGDQIVPVDIVGDEYIVNKGQLNNTSGEYAYAVATANNTVISIDGVTETTLFNGETYRIQIANPLTYITGTKPFYLIHISGFGCESGMALLPPLNCAGSEQVSFVRSTSENFFINLLVRTGGQDDFTLNGGAVTIDPADFDPVPGTGGEWVGAQIQFNTTQIPVGDANLITNSQEVFSLGLVNGGASSGCRFGYFSEFSSAIITDAGPDQTVCANQETILVGSVSGGATQGEWSTNGTGSFTPDATTLGTTYEPSLADLSAGQVTLTLTSVGNCFPVEDEIEITYTPAPIVDAGLAIVACGNNTTVTLDGFVDIATGALWSGGAGIFDPGSGTLDAEYTPTAQEITDGSVELALTSTGNGNCLEEFDTVEITFGPSPTADAGVDQSVCANNVQVVLSGAVTVSGGGAWSGGGGTYSPSDQALGATYTPSAVEILNGSLTLTLTTTNNGGCAQVTDQMTITITDAPIVNAGSDADVCSNNANITLNGSVIIAAGGTWSDGNGTYSTDENDLAAVYTPSLAELLAGSVTLTLSSTGNGNCLAVTDQVTYTFTDPPAVNAGTDGLVCENNALISLNGSLVGANFGLWSGGAGTFTPNTTTLTATYTPTASEIASGSITLSLTSLDNGNCNPESDDVIFTFTPSPTADAGSDQNVCENNADISLSGAVTVAGGGIWSGGSGSFSPNNTTLNAVYAPTTFEISSGSITLTLNTTGNENCSSVSDFVTINFTDNPTANAGADQVLCANNSEITLGGSVTISTGGTWSGGLGTFTPNANSSNTIYEPTQAEINSGSLTLTLTTTGGGNCIEVSDEVDFTFTPAPTAEAGVAISVCSNNAQISLNGSLTVASGGTWSGGAGTFIPNVNNLNALYNPTAAEIAAGSLVLTLTTTGNGNCVPEDDFVNISFTPAPTSNAGSDQTVCANDAEVNLSGSISLASGAIWSGGSGTFLPNNTSLGASYAPSAAEITAGSATLTLTTTGNGNCNAESDQMIIDITSAPVVDAGVGIELCSNNPEFTLGGSVTVATGATWGGGNGTFVPNANDLNATYTPSQGEINAGTLTLTSTSTGNGNCIAVSDVVTYTFGPSPTSDAGVDIVACANNAEVQLDGAVTIATGGAWSGGAGNYSPSANALDATYAPTLAEIAAVSLTLTLTTTDNGDCLPVTDEVEITFTPAPTANAGADQTVCANATDVTLSGSISIASGGVWSGGNGSFDNSSSLGAIYTPTALEIAAGTVTLTLNTTGNGNCNAVTDQMTITVTPAPIVDAGIGIELCSNNPEITLNGSLTTAMGGTWSGGSGTFTPNANVLNATYAPSQSEINAGTLTLTLTSTGNGNCVAVADNITYTFGPSPTADAGADIVLCSNNADVQLAGAITIAGGGAWLGGAGTYSPNANALNAEYTPTAGEIAAGTLTLILTTTGNGDCVPQSDDVEITFTPAPTVSASLDQTVCANSADVALNGSISVATGAIWTGGNGSFSPNASALAAIYTPSAGEIAAGTVTLTLTSIGNGDCISVADQMVITIAPSPVVDAGVETELCSNNPEISLNGSISTASGGTWSGGSGTFTPNANSLSATYTPSQSEINAGMLTLTLTSTGNGNCVAVTDDVTYTFGPSPTADAGTDIVLCSNNAAADLAGAVTIATGGTWSGGAGTYSPNVNTLNAEYTPTAAEISSGSITLTLTTTGNGDCLPKIDQVAISFTPSPTANAGLDVTVCANQIDVTLNGSVTVATGGTWSGGDGTFIPDVNAVGAIYSPSAGEIAAGTVTLNLTTTGNGDCVEVTDQMTITITPQPTVDAGVGIEVCSNNSEISLSGSVSTATGGTWSGGSGTFSPNANDLNATYTPSQSEINAGILALALTSTGNGTCIAVTDNVTYTFGPSPTSDVGMNIVACANNAEVQLVGAVTIATGGIWSGGNGNFSPSETTLNTFYTPTPLEIAAGSVTLTLTTTGNGDCTAVTDEVGVSFSPAPTANAGLDRTVCANAGDVTLNGSVTVATGGIWSGGNGTFTPDANTLGAIYSPSVGEIAAGSVTLTLTTTGNDDCNAVTDQMIITLTPEPSVDAGIGTELCSNNPEITLNGSVAIATGGTWSGGSGTFNPSANDLNATYTPSQSEINAGILTLTLTSIGNATCVPVTDVVTYTFGPSPTADAGTDIEMCSNNAIAQLTGVVTEATGGTWSGGAGSFSPNANALDAEYTPTAQELANGSVTLTLTTTGNADCLPVTDEVEISFTPAPTANAGIDQTGCANDAEVNLNGFVSVATGGTWSGGSGTFIPDANALNVIYVPSASEIVNGLVTLTLTTTGNADCLPESDQMTITIDPEPEVAAGADLDICSNNADVQLNGSVLNATGGQWTGGLGSFNPDNATLDAVYTPSPAEVAAGSITLTLTSAGNGNCLAESDAFVINFTPAPTADGGEDITLCAATPNASLNGAFTVAGGAIWSGGNGAFSPNATNMSATYTPTPQEIVDGSVTLTLTTTANANCVPESDEVTIFFDPEPTITAGSNLISCANNPTVQLEGAFTNASGVQWAGGTGFFNPNDETANAIYTPSAAEITNGFVSLTIESLGTGACPQISDQMSITITPAPVVDAGANLEVCANNNTAQLSGSVQFAGGGQWSGGLGNFTPSNNSLTASYQPTAPEIAAGSVTLTLTSLGNGSCDAVSDQIIISFTPAPVIDAGVDQTLCENNPDVQLAGSFTVSEGANWSGGAGSYSPDNSMPNVVYTPSASELANGTVTLTYTTFGNGNCLPVSDQVTFNFTPSPVVEAGDDFFACVDDLAVLLNGQVTGGSTTGTWTTSGTGIFVPNASALNGSYLASSQDSLIGEITLTLTSANNGNCIAVSDDFTVFISPAGTAEAGPDQFICGNNANISLSGSIGGAATEGAWISSGAGVFLPNNEGTNVNYIPSDDDLVNGSVTFTFEVNSCNQAADNVLVTFTPAPEVIAGADITVCSSEVSVDLTGLVSGASSTGTWTTSGSGSFSPNADNLNATYVFSSADVDDQIIELILTSTNIEDCIVVTDTLTLEIFPQGSVNVGDDIVTCDNSPDAEVSATINGGDQILWSSTGTGSFVPNNTFLSATYVPSAGDLLNGSVNLTATVTNSCNQASDFLNLSFIPGPAADAGEGQAVCGVVIPFQISGNVASASGGLWTTTGSGSFQNANNLSTFYVASQADIDNGGVFLVLTTTGNGNCFADSDSLFLDINTGVALEAGPDQVVCSEAGSTQLFGQVSDGTTTGIWTSTGDGTFSPSATSLNATYNFTQNDIDEEAVTLTLTSTNNGICSEASDSFELTFGDGAFVYAGEDKEVCETQDLVNLNGVVNGDSNTGIWTTTGTGGFFPTNTSLNAFYEPSQADLDAGSVEITLTSTNSVLCNEGTANIIVTFQPLPEANAGADALICGPIEGVQLLGFVTGASGGVWETTGSGVFMPNDSVLTAIYMPSQADSIIGGATLTLTTYGNGFCAAGNDQVEVSFSVAVTANAGIDVEICENQVALQVTGTVSGSSNFNWTTSGGGTFTPQSDVLNSEYQMAQADLDAGIVTLYLTAQGNGSCPAFTDSLVVSIDRVPGVEIIAEVAVCTSDPAVELNGNVSDEDSFIWTSTGAGTFSPDNVSEEVTYTPSVAELAAGVTTISLTATSDGVCGSNSEDFEVTFAQPPTVGAGADQIGCSADGSVLLAGSSSTGEAIWSTSSFGTFDPDNTSLDATYVFGVNDILVGFAELVITSTNNGPCDATTDTVRFTINPAPMASAGPDQFVCESSGLLSMSGSAENFATIEWSTEGDGMFLNTGDDFAPEYIFGNADAIAEQVQIILTATGLEGCAEAADTMLVNINAPLAAAYTHSNACVGSPVQFTDATVIFEGEIDGYVWDFGNGIIDNQQNPTFVFNQAGSQSVQFVVESSLGCTDTTTQLINVAQGPQAAFTVNQFRAPVNFDFIFDDQSIGAEQWNWNFGDGLGITQVQNPTYNYPDEGDYLVTLIVAGSTGCVDSVSLSLILEGQTVLPPRLPNSFSPNGDNTNDLYYVRGGPFIKLDFKVYDNWGREIFQTINQEVGWDGTENGSDVPVGVYVYTIKATNLDGETFDYSGRINLFR